MAIYEYRTKIRYNEIDENNQLSDKGLLNILSEAAGLHSQEVGYGLNSIEDTNCTWMILYWKIKIFKRPKWSTELIVKTWGREFSKIYTWRDYEVYSKEGEKIAISSTQWVSIDTQKGSLRKITDKVRNDYGIVEKSIFEEPLVGKLQEPENLEKIYEYTAKRRDIDTNNHVNNINYLDFAYDALPKEINVNFSNIEIYYKKQIKLGEDIACFYKKENDSHIVAIKSIDGNTLHVILKFY